MEKTGLLQKGLIEKDIKQRYQELGCVKNIIAAVVIIKLLTGSTVFAQWEQLGGPDGETVNELAINNEYMFAATNYGVYRNSVGDSCWKSVKKGLPHAKILSVATCGPVVFAATIGALFKSSDNGDHWKSIYTTTDELVQLCSVNDSFVIVSTGEPYGHAGGRGIYRIAATDTVFNSSSGMNDDEINSFAVSGSQVLAGGFGRVYKSTDCGVTWTTLPGLVAGTDSWSVNTVAFFDSSYLAGSFYGLFALYPDSTQWTPVAKSIKDLGVSAMIVDGQKILISRNQSYLISSQGGGVIRSLDNGGTWDTLCSGFPNRAEVRMFVKYKSAFYAATNYGVYRSNDDGKTWTPLNSGLRTSTITALASCNGSLYAGTLEQGIYRSTDRGKTWSTCLNRLKEPAITSLLAEGDDLLAGSDGGAVQWFNATKGDWWNAVPYYHADDLGYMQSLGSNGKYIFAMTQSNGVSFAKTDEFDRWGLFDFESGGSIVYGYCLGKFDNMMLASLSSGLYICDSVNYNLGAFWKERCTGYNFNSFAQRGSDLYAATPFSGVFVSHDTGKTWDSASIGLDTYNAKRINALMKAGNGIFAGTGEGVVLLTDTSKAWLPVNEGLPDTTFIKSFMLDGEYLYAGTAGYGIWRRTLTQMTGTVCTPKFRSVSQQSFRITLVNGTVTIFASDGNVKDVMTEFYTPDGRKAGVKPNYCTKNGSVFTGPLSSGLYTVKIKTATEVLFRKIAVVK